MKYKLTLFNLHGTPMEVPSLLYAFEESAEWTLFHFLRWFKLSRICTEVTSLLTGEVFESIGKPYKVVGLTMHSITW